MKTKLITAFIISTLLTSPGWAIEFREVKPKQHYDPSLWYQEELYIDRMFGKLLFGAWNFFLGPFEILKEPYEAYTLGDNIFVGVGRGLFYAVADTAGGFLNGITAPITPLRIPLPQGGVEHRRF